MTNAVELRTLADYLKLNYPIAKVKTAPNNPAETIEQLKQLVNLCLANH
jgi:hypothetical protein